MSEAVVLIDDGQRIVLFNRAAEQMFGYAVREVLGQLIDMLLPETARATHRRLAEDFAAAPERYRSMAGRPKIQGRRKDGTLFPAQAALSKTTVAGHIYTAAVVYDLSDLDAMRQSLDVTDTRYRALFIQNPVGIVFVGLDGKWFEVNPTAGVLLGRKPAELVGRSFEALTHPEDVEEDRRLLRQLLAGEIPMYSREKRYLRGDGTTLWADVTVAPLRTSEGVLRHLIVIIEDAATARWKELGAIIEESSGEIFIFDTETLRFAYVNQGACHNLGYTKKELLALTPLDLKPEFTLESFAALVQPLRDHTRKVVTFTTVHRRKDGTPYDVEVRLQLTPFDGRLSFLAFIEDITERRRLEEQLFQAGKMESIGQLTGGIAHDFNNLLQVILGNVDLLEGELAEETSARRAAHMIKLAGERAAKLTQHLLAFARRQPLRSESLNLGDVASSLQPFLAQTLGESIDVRIELSATPVIAAVDRTQLESALLNLAVNARDAMPDGGTLTIAVDTVVLDEAAAALRELPPATYGRLRVRDTGCGMAPEVRAKAFEPFFTTKEVGKGTGLGLSMVYGFAKQSGGEAAIDSKPGGGTTVTILLPLGKPGIPAETAPAAAGVQLSAALATILVVEDDVFVRAYVSGVIRELGYSVIEAEDGPSALARLAEAPRVDLLFTDVILPGGLNGRELAEKARETRPGLKVLFTSGYPKNVIVQQGRLDLGVQLLAKPYRKAALVRALRDSLAGRTPTTKAETGE